MKKKYFAPTIKLVKIELLSIMAGSDDAPDEWGDSSNFGFQEEEEESQE